MISQESDTHLSKLRPKIHKYTYVDMYNIKIVYLICIYDSSCIVDKSRSHSLFNYSKQLFYLVSDAKNNIKYKLN